MTLQWRALRTAVTAALAAGTPVAPIGAMPGGVTVQMEEERLLAADVGSGDGFGSAVAVDGDTVLVGARTDQASGATNTGAVYVFRRTGTVWSLEDRLVAPDAAADDRFGTSVALDGDTALVGARLDDTSSGVDVGSAYVFVRSGTTWTFQQKLEALDGAGGDELGASLDLQGDLAVLGAPFDDDAGLASGSAYVFLRAGGVWNQVTKLAALDAAGGDELGQTVCLDGGTIVAGAPGETLDRGAAYVFVGAGSIWSQQAKLVASDGLVGDRFGRACLDGDTLAVGATEALAFTGAAYVFERTGTVWGQTLKVVAPDGQVGDRLGSALALGGEALVLGAQGHDAVQPSAGAAYVWRREGTSWAFVSKLLASDSVSVNLVGAAAAMSGATVVLGGPGPIGGALPGSAYVFSIDAGPPSFCDAGDGSLASCPCGNAGLPDTGCDVQQGTGGVRLDVIEQVTGVENRATLAGSGFPAAFSPTAILIRAPALDPATPVTFGDGLRCVAVPLVRLGATFANAGASTHTFGHGAMAGTGTFYYQTWFRNTPAMYCTPDAFNLSNGRQLSW